MLQFLLSISDESNHGKIEDIFYKFHGKMLTFAERKLLLNNMQDFKHNAEDAVQNAFVKIVKNIDKIDFARGEKDVKNYVFSILVNEIYNILEKSEIILEFDEEFYPNEEYNIIDEINMQEIYEKVVLAFENLDEKYSSTLYLFYNEGMSIKEIAKTMGISEKTAYTRFERGKKLIKNVIKENK